MLNLAHLEIRMSATRTVAHTRRNSRPEDCEGPDLDEVLNLNKDKNKANWKAKEAAPKAAGNKSTGGRAREPAFLLGDVTWNNLFWEEVKLEGINFMEWLDKELTKEESNKLAEDIKKALLKKKEEFCKADYMSLLDAKTQLMTLLTEKMTDKAGFVVDEILEDC